MSTLAHEELITAEQLFAMGDVGPCELIDGRIVPLSPTSGEHGRLECNLAFELGIFVQGKALGWTLSGEVGIFIRRNPDRVRAADVAFLSRARAPEGPSKGFLELAPDLVAEIISPTDRWLDIRAKLEDYFSIGVRQVWIVEPDTRNVLVYRSPTEAEKLGERDTIRGEGVLKAFSLPVARLFTDE
jgi:Uma2 family endonuclease